MPFPKLKKECPRDIEDLLEDTEEARYIFDVIYSQNMQYYIHFLILLVSPTGKGGSASKNIVYVENILIGVEGVYKLRTVHTRFAPVS